MAHDRNRELNEQLARLVDKVSQDSWNEVAATPTAKLARTELYWCDGLKFLICRRCSKTLNTTRAVHHILRHHRAAWTSMSADETAAADGLLAEYMELDGFDCARKEQEEVRAWLPHDKLYLPQLPVNLHGHKCRLCRFVALDEKNVRRHLNRVHPEVCPKQHAQVKAKRSEYVMYGVPLQELGGFKDGVKFFFIPRLPVLSTGGREADEGGGGENDIGDADADARADAEVEVEAEAVLQAHQQEESERKQAASHTESNTGNAKLLDAWRRKCGILSFIGGKNPDTLLDLRAPHHESRLTLAAEYNFYALEKAVEKYEERIHNGIESSSLRLRQLLRSEDSFTQRRDMKDFMRLDAPEKYFRVGSRLIVWLLRIVLIKRADQSQHDIAAYVAVADAVDVEPTVTAAAGRILELSSAWTDMYDGQDEQRDVEWQDAVAGLTRALLHKIPMLSRTDHTARHPVACYYFARCLDAQTKMIARNVISLSNVLSALIYFARLMALGWYQQLEEAAMGPAGEGDAWEVDAAIQRDIADTLNNTSQNYFDWLTTIRPYAIKLSEAYESEGPKVWEPQPDVMSFGSVLYPIASIRVMFQRISADLDSMMRDQLLMVHDVNNALSIDFDNIEDSTLLVRMGESILDTTALAHLENWFVKQLLDRRTSLSKRLVAGVRGGQILWKTAAVGRYLSAVTDFTALLSCAVNLFSGGPLRGSELNTITYKNTANAMRSLLYNAQYGVMIVETYHRKTNNITRRRQLNSRLLVPSLSKTVIRFVAAVLPGRDYLYRKCEGQPEYDNPFLLCGSKAELSSDVISNTLMKVSGHFFSRGFGIKVWRQLISQINQTKLGYDIYGEGGEEDEGEDTVGGADDGNGLASVGDKMMNHSVRVGRLHYFNASNLMGLKGGLGDRKLLTAFSEGYFRFWGLSSELEFGGGQGSGGSRRQSQDTATVSTALTGINKEMFAMDIVRMRQQLSNLYGGSRESSNTRRGFRPGQAEALHAIMSGTPYVTYISKTGSGKSLAYLLPAFVKKERLWLVLTPRVALRHDLIAKAKRLGLSAGGLHEAISHSQNLVFADVEDLNTPEIDSLINGRMRWGKQVTVMLDEAHLFILEAGWRTKLRDLKSVVRQRPNVVFITATMPVQLLRLMNKEFGISNNVVCRGSSSRSDVQYVRREYKPARRDQQQQQQQQQETEEKVLLQIVQQIDQADEDIANKCLVFVNRKTKGEEIAALLGVDFMFSGKENAQQLLEEWTVNKSTRYLVTTSVLEVGLDLSCIKYTISLEPLSSLLSFVQSSGRIRKAGTSYVVCAAVKRAQSAAEEQQEGRLLLQGECENVEAFQKVDKAYMQRFKREKECLRVPIGNLLDGWGGKCGLTDAWCSLCQAREAQKEAVGEAEDAEQRSRGIAWTEMQLQFGRWKRERCWYCMLDPYNCSHRPSSHTIEECGAHAWKDEEFKGLITTVRELCRRDVREGGLDTELGCHGCLFPKNLCGRMTNMAGMEWAEDCLLGEMLKQITAMMWMWREDLPELLRERIQKVIGVDIAVEEQLSWFVNRAMVKDGWHGLATTRLVMMLQGVDLWAMIEEIEQGRDDDDDDVSSSSSSSSSSSEESEEESAETSGGGGRGGNAKRPSSTILQEVRLAKERRRTADEGEWLF